MPGLLRADPKKVPTITTYENTSFNQSNLRNMISSIFPRRMCCGSFGSSPRFEGQRAHKDNIAVGQ